MAGAIIAGIFLSFLMGLGIGAMLEIPRKEK